MLVQSSISLTVQVWGNVHESTEEAIFGTKASPKMK